MVKNAILLLILFHALIFIPIPEAHGYGFMIFMDLISCSSIFRKIFFAEQPTLEPTYIIMGLFSLLNKITLTSTLFLSKWKRIIRIMGLLFIILSWSCLFFNYTTFDVITLIIILSSIPFLMYFARVLYLISKE